MINKPEYLEKLDKSFVKKYLVFPYDFDEQTKTLKIASDSAEKKYLADNLSIYFNYPYKFEIFDKDLLDKEIDNYYLSRITEPQDNIDGKIEQSSNSENGNNAELEITSEIKKKDLLYNVNVEEPIIKLVNKLLIDALVNSATDIHIEPLEEKVLVRYRLNGVLYTKNVISKTQQPAISSRIKILANLDISETRLPQDGSFQVAFAGRRIDFRVSTIPLNFGERIVLRVLDKSKFLLKLENLELSDQNYLLLKKIIASPNGIVLVTGPTGSGKTTTLYALLSALKEGKKNIITIEDPIEYQISEINQIQVKPEIGLTFAAGLRSILRQDPDIIMVGEIRDEETMSIAIRASLTGHLVFSTLHTNDAVSAIARLYDMGLKPYLISSSLICVIAQRLAKILCSRCKTDDKEGYKKIKALNLNLSDNLKFYKSTGCAYCKNTGIIKRRGIFEIVIIDSKIREMILQKRSADDIRKYCITNGVSFLKDAALELLKNGEISVDEIISLLSVENEI